VVKGFYRTLKYEHLYRLEIPNAHVLTEEVDRYLEIYNRIRPHESIGQVPPSTRYLAEPNLFRAECVQQT
jgi:transposase InsO family protein